MDLSEINISFNEAGEGVASVTPSFSPLNIAVTCNTNGQKARRHVRTNSAKGYAQVRVLPENDRVAVLVGGGPSLKDTWKEVAFWRLNGADVFALNGAVKFLNDRGILPQYQLIVDPRPQNTALIGMAGEHFIASQCHPSLFKAVNNPVVVNMAGSCLKPDRKASKLAGKPVMQPIVEGTLIGGDVTVGLVAMCLAHTLGFRTLHLYGYDSSYTDGEHHAYPQDQSEQERKRLEVFAKDASGEMKKFATNYAMAKQAELFPKTAAMLCEAGSQILVHGTGLLPTIAHSMLKPQAQAAA